MTESTTSSALATALTLPCPTCAAPAGRYCYGTAEHGPRGVCAERYGRGAADAAGDDLAERAAAIRAQTPAERAAFERAVSNAQRDARLREREQRVRMGRGPQHSAVRTPQARRGLRR
jgi:hypothetical protein